MEVISKSAVELGRELEALGFSLTEFSDRTYIIPHLDWVIEYSKWVKNAPIQYIEESEDCDDISDAAVTEAMFAQNANPALHGRGKAFFRCTVTINNGQLNGVPEGGHATNIIRVSDGYWILFERQNGKWCKVVDALAGGNVSPGECRL